MQCLREKKDKSVKKYTVASDVSQEPEVGVVSTMKLSRPVRIVDTDQAGFHLLCYIH